MAWLSEGCPYIKCLPAQGKHLKCEICPHRTNFAAEGGSTCPQGATHPDTKAKYLSV